MLTKMKMQNKIKNFSKRNILVFFVFLMGFFISGVFVLPVFASSTDGTIDSTYRYAWTENTGWLNFGTTEGNVHITDSALTGYVWAENIGWISLNCSNDNSCSTVDYKVSNDGEGTLSGYAWGENIGWINFNPTYGGVTINFSGEFLGYAWGENIGWIVFNCSTANSCGTVDYKVKTDWRPQSVRPVCNNSSDDDGDGKTDYPNDPGCSSLDDNDETDSVSGGGGMPIAWYNPPKAPEGDFRILINSGVEYTNSPVATLNLFGGPDTERMAISNFSDFRDAGQEKYQTSKSWDLCKGKGVCLEGEYIVYVKFYAPWGKSSEVVSDGITYKKEEKSIEEPITKLPPPEVKPPTEKLTSKESEFPTGQVAEIPTNYRFTTDLKYNQRGDDVRYLQIFLKFQGPDIYPESIVSGWFGPLTKNAVIRFQEKYASDILAPWGLINGTGFVGKTTRDKINEILGQ